MAHEVPPQDEFLYNGTWNAEMDDILLCNLINDKLKFPVGDDYIPAQGLLMSMGILSQKFQRQFDWDEVYERYEFMRYRYETFKNCRNFRKSGYDMHTNQILASDETWAKIFKKNKLAKAYYHKGEPEIEKLTILFCGDHIKQEISHTVVNISDTVSPVAKRMYEPVVVSDDEEITSPMCASYSASHRRLFDEDSGESPIAKVFGSVPPPKLFPSKAY